MFQKKIMSIENFIDLDKKERQFIHSWKVIQPQSGNSGFTKVEITCKKILKKAYF